MTRNLPTDDPTLAAKFMTATAEQATRVRNAAYHVMLAWHPSEQPTAEIMQEIAGRVLELADLGEHQALIMGHGDTPHRHLHMLINRVSPLTGRAWKTSHDYARFDRILTDLAETYGFQPAPAHAYHLTETEHLPKKPTTPATYAAKRGANTKRPHLSRIEASDLGGRISDQLDHASSWEDVARAFQGDGLTLEPKGSGFVVCDATRYAKLSSLNLTHSAKGFAKQFGPYQPQKPTSSPSADRIGANAVFRKSDNPQRCALFSVDAVDIKRALATYGLVDNAEIQHTIAEARDARLARRHSSDPSHARQAETALCRTPWQSRTDQIAAFSSGRILDRLPTKAQPSR